MSFQRAMQAKIGKRACDKDEKGEANRKVLTLHYAKTRYDMISLTNSLRLIMSSPSCSKSLISKPRLPPINHAYLIIVAHHLIILG